MLAHRTPLILAGGAVSVLMLLGGCGSAPEGATPAGPTATAAFNATDVTFVQTLLPHHRQGIEIAQLGAARAARPEVKVLAKAIAATQQDEVTKMQAWLTGWQQPASAAAQPPPSGVTDQDIAALRSRSVGFDKAFLDLLLAHQDQAVNLARVEESGGQNPGAVAFATQVDQSRTAEIDQMRTFLKAAP